MARDIELSFDEASDILAALEEAADAAARSGQFALQIQVEDAIGIMVTKMFPDLPPAEA
jgi:hypothetical protein